MKSTKNKYKLSDRALSWSNDVQMNSGAKMYCIFMVSLNLAENDAELKPD